MSVLAAARGQLAGYGRLLKLRDYRLLWSAQVASTFGDRLSQVALATLVYSLTDSELSIGIVLTMTVLPRALFGLVAGSVADRASRKSLLVGTDVTRALIVALLAAAAGLPLPAIYALTFLSATATVFFTPTRAAVLPDLVPEDRLLTANTLDETTQSALDPLAFVLGGALVAAAGARLGFAVDAATFAVSAALIALTTPRQATQWHAPEDGSRSPGLAAGLQALWRQPVLRANTFLMLFAATTASAELPLTYMMAMTHWHTGALGIGFLEAGLAVGFVIGALLCESLVRSVGRGPAILIGLVGTGATMSLMAVVPFWPAVVFSTVSGIFNVFFFVPTLTLTQELAPAATRGRVLGARATLMAFALLASYGVATALSTFIAPALLLGCAGALLAGGALLAALFPILRIR